MLHAAVVSSMECGGAGVQFPPPDVQSVEPCSLHGLSSPLRGWAPLPPAPHPAVSWGHSLPGAAPSPWLWDQGAHALQLCSLKTGFPAREPLNSLMNSRLVLSRAGWDFGGNGLRQGFPEKCHGVPIPPRPRGTPAPEPAGRPSGALARSELTASEPPRHRRTLPGRWCRLHTPPPRGRPALSWVFTEAGAGVKDICHPSEMHLFIQGQTHRAPSLRAALGRGSDEPSGSPPPTDTVFSV